MSLFLSCPPIDAPLRRPLGDLLDELFKESVAQIGDGLTLGMSSHMMKFFSMPGPFVGMCVCVSSGMERREGRKVKGRGGDGEMGRWLEREERGGEGYKTVLRANKQWRVWDTFN